MKFAAIDIGSNAVRLLLTRVFETNTKPFFKKESLVRIPLRLGEEAFAEKFISEQKSQSLVNTMIAFKYLIDAYQPIDSMACATSAMRDAGNGDLIVKEINARTGFNLEIVDGKREAQIIFSNHVEQYLDEQKSYLYIDVGGGSTELTLFSDVKTIDSKSFDIGTIRLLKNLVTKEKWGEMKKWIKEFASAFQPIAIGSGGNINKIFRLSGKKEGKPLSYKTVRSIYNNLKSFSFEQRIQNLGLRPDRADVIIPASDIYLSVMKWAGIDKIYVPQVGLADGLIHILYEKHKGKNI